MSNEPLTDAEKDLLSGVSASDLLGTDPTGPSGTGPSGTGPSETGPSEAVATDGNARSSDPLVNESLPMQPECRFNELQRRNFQSIHEVLADRVGHAWSQKLRGAIDVRVTKTVESKFGEFSFGLDNPTCFMTLAVAPLLGHVCLEIHPTVLFPMIDRLLGGGKKAGPIVRRPLTDIERRLLGRLAAIFFDAFRVAWRQYAVLSPEIIKIESNPKLSRCVPAADAVESVEFEVSMPFARGPIRMAYQSASLVPLQSHLSEQAESPFGLTANEEQRMADVRVVIAQRALEPDASELLLQVGDLIDTGVAVGGFAELHVNGEPAFVGQVGQCQGKKAFRIEDAAEQLRAG